MLRRAISWGLGVLSLVRISRRTLRSLVDLPCVVPASDFVPPFAESGYLCPMRARRHTCMACLRIGVASGRAPFRSHRFRRGVRSPCRTACAELSALLPCRQSRARHGRGSGFFLRSRDRQERESPGLRGPRATVHGPRRFAAKLANPEPGVAMCVGADPDPVCLSRLSQRRGHAGVPRLMSGHFLAVRP